MLHLRNLRSSDLVEGCEPWEFTGRGLVPADCITDKAARDIWINLPETEYYIYSMFEGPNPNLRIRGGDSEKEDGEGNPPLYMRGIALDYDSALSLERAKSILETIDGPKPAWLERTLSGNYRLVWLIERVLKFPTRKFVKSFLSRLPELIPGMTSFPGLDRGAWMAPERYFTNGGDWTKLSNDVIPFQQLQGLFFDVANTYQWNDRELGKVIDIKAVEAECRKRYPRFAEWTGAFEMKAQGPSFWVDGSTSVKSARVCETGMLSLAAHASKNFYSWAEIVGSSFVDTTDRDSLGKAIDDIYYDGKNFIYKDADGCYAYENKENLRLELLGERGVSDKKGKGDKLTPVEKAMHFITKHHKVDIAAHCAFYPLGVFNWNGQRILNTHLATVMPPAPDGTVWGDLGKFPWLSRFFDSLFDPATPQRDRLLAWFKRVYVGCLRRQPNSGHGVFLAGGVGVGKTLCSQEIFGVALGGSVEAAAYLTGQTAFNSELFNFILWRIDDGSIAADLAKHRIYSERVKQITANPAHHINTKFRVAGMTQWQGRLFVTLNLDADSLRMIPNVDMSMLEKVMLFKTLPKSIVFPEEGLLKRNIAIELPHFLRWIIDWTPPSHCFEGAESRFGLVPYHHPDLLASAVQSSDISSFAELVQQWMKQYFDAQPLDVLKWEGTVTQLRMEMLTDGIFSEMLRGYKTEQIARFIQKMQGKPGIKMELEDVNGQRLIRFFRVAPPELTVSDLPSAQGSKYQKKYD